MLQLARISIYATQAVYGVIAGYFFANPESIFSDDGVFLGVMALVSVVLLALPAIISCVPRFRERLTTRVLLALEGLLATITLFAWIGTFGLFKAGIGYDSLVHFLSSALGIGVALLALPIFYPNISLMPRLRLIIFAVCLVFAAGVVNEFFEKFGDAWWGTQMYGEWGDPRDTERDLAYDALGAIVGAFSLGLGRRSTPQTQ